MQHCVRFVGKGEKPSVTDQYYPTKGAAIDAIKLRNFKPGPRILDPLKGRVRIAYEQ